MIDTDLTPEQVRKGFAQGITYTSLKTIRHWVGGQGCVEGREALKSSALAPLGKTDTCEHKRRS